MEIPAAQKRFYTSVSTEPVDGGFVVKLDRYTLRSPARSILALPTAALATLVADEWASQVDLILPQTMPITRLANVALDRGRATRADLIGQVIGYLDTDLTCYRVDRPPELASRQSSVWNPLLSEFEAHTGTRLATTTEIAALSQPQTASVHLRTACEAMDEWRLTALAFVTGLTGSVVIAWAMVRAACSAKQAFEAIRIEEDWNASIWGADAEEEARWAARKSDMEAVEAYLSAL